jgi:ABC-type transport system involved in multi-copper enzyme maturation permease subunit
MMWFAWRTQRLQLIVAAVAAAGFMGWLYLTGSHEHSAWVALNQHHCMSAHQESDCNHLWSVFSNADRWTDGNIFILNAIPALLGLLFGAPLVAREIEQGTNRFAWSQSITRGRWLAFKLTLGLAFTALIMAILIPVVGWWADAAETGSHIVPKTFDIVGIVPLFYGLFAFMLGAALGSLIRRTGWSIAVGVAAFAGVRLGVDSIRVHFAPLALSATKYAFSSGPGAVDNGWIQNSGFVPIDRLTPKPGQTWQSADTVFNRCINKVQHLHPQQNFSQVVYDKQSAFCGAYTHLHFVYQYQPLSNFWRVQGVESGLYFGATLVLLAVTVLAVRRWRT